MGMNILVALVAGMLCVALTAACQRSATQTKPADKDKIHQPFRSALLEEHQNRSKGPQLIQGDRLILGKVVAIASKQIEVDIGEI